ncbi:MAG: 30S ribosomal protein S4 [Candidatus Omnitrophota bacterium]|jgi:small subunit ribosomal protein S4
MARYTGATCRLCRREGEKLFLKGTKCNSPKCTLTKRAYAPGDHGQGRIKLSNYGVQLREKQKVKRIYGMMEGQFRKYFEQASMVKGVTGKVLLQQLERRLDNVIFRLGLAVSRAQARQVVRHNFIWIDGTRVNIPSYQVSKDEVIKIKASEKALNKLKENIEASKDRSVPTWLEFNQQEMTARVTRLPEKEDIQATIKEQLIVELYSK